MQVTFAALTQSIRKNDTLREKLTILLVEDRLAEANVLKFGLNAISHPQVEIDHVTRLAAAASALEMQRYDAVLLDLALPDGEGSASIQQLVQQAPATPVIVLSGIDDRDMEIESIRAGAQGFVVIGTMEPRVLARLVMHAVERHRLHASDKSALQELTVMNAQFRRLISDNADAMLVIDATGAAKFVNPAAETLLGRPARDLIDALVGLPIEAGHAVEMNIVRPDGREIVADMRVTPTLWEGEDMFLASLRDVTQRKALEHSLREEAMNANAAAEARAAFLANMSHELRTPLNCIIGYIDLIRSEIYGPIANEKYEEYIEIAIGAGNELLDMIADVLELARADADKISLDEAEFQLDVMIREALMTATPIIQKAGIKMDARLEKVTVFGDEKRFKQVVLNLLSNAAKFTQPGGSVSVMTEMTAAGALEVSVCDTGVGIPQNELPELFNHFHQSKSASADPKTGIGLGLSICKHFVELHGGEIVADSVVGKGATFTFSVPAERIVSADIQEHPNAFDGELRRMWL